MNRRRSNSLSIFSTILAVIALIGFLTAGVRTVYLHERPRDQRQLAGEKSDSLLPSSAQWAVDPLTPGPDVPEQGRSAFAAIMTSNDGRVNIPFPFTALLAKLRLAVGSPITEPGETNAGVVGVLIPRGRSLQRSQTSFEAPRVVVAVTGETAQGGASPGTQLQNRLYLGYSEQARSIEVISYNEAAGRFEFQTVQNYGPEKQPMLGYASRQLCLQCHQNQGPIFSEAGWLESNANASVAAEIEKRIHVQNSSSQKNQSERKSNAFYQGLSIRTTDDAPAAIDQAIGEANLFAAYQKIWRDVCGSTQQPTVCRQFLLQMALRQGLTKQVVYRSDLERKQLREIVDIWLAKWPRGLKIPGHHIPNRDPFRDVQLQDSIPEEFAPTKNREPEAIWQLTQKDSFDLESAFAGLGAFVTRADRHMLDQTLFSLGESSPGRKLFADCTMIHDTADLLKISCVGTPTQDLQQKPTLVLHLSYNLKNRKIATMVLGTDENAESCAILSEAERSNPRYCKATGTATFSQTSLGSFLNIEPFETTEGLHFRLPNGDAVQRLEISWKDSAMGHLQMSVLNDFEILNSALSKNGNLFADQPFGREKLLRELNSAIGFDFTSQSNANFIAHVSAPSLGSPQPPVLEKSAVNFGEPALNALVSSCRSCHEGHSGNPAGWLRAGTKAELEAQILNCGERIYYRLSRWEGARSKDQVQEMPPRSYVHDETQWTKNRAVIMAYLLGKMHLSAKDAESQILSQSYDSFARCRSRAQ
jgi:hypothetical protein